MSEGPPLPPHPPGLPPIDPASRRPRLAWLEPVLADSAWRGMAFALLAAIAGVVAALSCLVVPVVGQLVCIAFGGFPGLAQLVWIVPLDRWAARRGRSRLRSGLWIGASVVFLLNSACWGLVLTQFKM